MTIDDFIAGKYGLSHGAVSVALIAVGTGVGYLFGSALLGNVFASGAAVGAYYMREAVQGRSYNPAKWGVDGRLDALLPAVIVAANLVGLALWNQ